MKYQIFAGLLVLTVVLAACAPAAISPTPPPIMTDEPPAPVLGLAVVQSVEIRFLESMPIQVHAVIRGQLPDAGCTTISDVTQARDGNTFNIEVTTTTDPLALCAQALTSFEQVVLLDVTDLPPAPYVVNANGVRQTFKLLPRDMDGFKLALVQALNAQDYEALGLMMDTSLRIALWRSDGSTYDVEPAIEQLRSNHLGADSIIVAEPEMDMSEFPEGADPFSAFGLDVGPTHALFVSGWGLDGKDEAILYMNYLLDGSLYWHGVLVAIGGFV